MNVVITRIHYERKKNDWIVYLERRGRWGQSELLLMLGLLKLLLCPTETKTDATEGLHIPATRISIMK